MLQRFIIVLFCCLTGLSLSAQDMSGIWRGYFVTENYEHYKFELQIKQSGNSVSGVSYSYLSTVFYGKASLTGSYNKAGKKILIQEIRTVELRMSDGSAACIMKCNFEYSRSGKEEFLEGTYTSKFEKDGLLTKKGENCGGGKVYLRRVANSDFYIEPFLRGKVKPGPILINKAPVKSNPADKKTSPVLVNKAPVKKDTVKAKVNPPVVKKPPVVKNPPVVTKPKPVIRKDTAVLKPVAGNLAKHDSAMRKVKPALITPAPPDIKNRINELVKTLTIHSNQVTVKLFDNGEIDGDTISVYLDNKKVLSEKRLTAAPLVLRFDLSEQEDEHELTMVAENLGTIPPNTSLMIVEAGTQRFEVRITSTEQKNAVVKFRYQKPG
ncbi:MAG TPA: hypothetical protein PLU11_10325 [Chitinophagaceae bacterium]|nr:hypothetical protein [Chitinophagaceae bacterium]HPH32218.1 hypothetical protein [Chitinophagaceae bacterium]HPN59563.1 hypothetical protein [Chitinophagaceae bacterium]